MVKISDYDKFDYNYKNYWKDREYEDKAEKIVLEGYLQNMQGNVFVDIGGSFGRNLEMYYEKYSIPIVLDYSIRTLQKNKEELLKRHPKTKLIAANAYKMPFKNETVDGSMIVRVLHHLEDQNGIFKEIDRITQGGGFFILEYANKMHIKAILKWIFTLRLKNFSLNPYQQPNQENFEGTKKGQTAIFLNYHPKYIKKLIEQNNFSIVSKRNCSFLRMEKLKKILSLKFLLKIERLLQKFLSWSNFAPSIVLKTKKLGNNSNNVDDFEKVLCCPDCKGGLNIQENTAKCVRCDKIFKNKLGVWDFRA
jgi:ubiquinone/menaquinone biosynthesis C-methylase UbiE